MVPHLAEVAPDHDGAVLGLAADAEALVLGEGLAAEESSEVDRANLENRLGSDFPDGRQLAQTVEQAAVVWVSAVRQLQGLPNVPVQHVEGGYVVRAEYLRDDALPLADAVRVCFQLDVLLETELQSLALLQQAGDLLVALPRVELALLIEEPVELLLPLQTCFVLALELLGQVSALSVVLEVATGAELPEQRVQLLDTNILLAWQLQVVELFDPLLSLQLCPRLVDERALDRQGGLAEGIYVPYVFAHVELWGLLLRSQRFETLNRRTRHLNQSQEVPTLLCFSDELKLGAVEALHECLQGCELAVGLVRVGSFVDARARQR